MLNEEAARQLPPPRELPDNGIPGEGPPLRVRKDPPEPTKREQEVLDLLWREFRKSDDVARAAARFEVDVHNHLVQQRIDEGYSVDEAGAVQRVFRADAFNETFRKLLQLRMERQLIQKLRLQDYEEAIMQERIQSVFGPPPTATKQLTLSADGQVRVGSPGTQHIQDLKARGRRRG